MRSPREVYAAFASRLQDLPVEEFHVAVLDSQHRLERDIAVTRGILNSSLVHPREVFREAIAERAAAIIDAVVAEWQAMARDPDVGDVWFARPCPAAGC